MFHFNKTSIKKIKKFNDYAYVRPYAHGYENELNHHDYESDRFFLKQRKKQLIQILKLQT